MQARRKRNRHLLLPRRHQPCWTTSPSSRARSMQRGPWPETSHRSSQLRRIGSVQLFRIKAVISLTWNSIRITPVPDGPELEQNLKKKALLQFPVQIPGDFTGILYALCKNTWTLIDFIPFLPALFTTSCVSQRHTATLQYLNKILTHPILSADPPSHTSKYQKQDRQLWRWPRNYREVKKN